MATTSQQGKIAETVALNYLSAQGLTLVIENFRSKHGEIDLIMHDKDYLVFIEVRLRTNADFGSGLDSISANKQRKLRNTANFYLQKHYGNRFPACRFDVVSLNEINDPIQLEWIKNAF